MVHVIRAVAMAVAASLLLTGPVSADTVSGQTGHYLFTDSNTATGAKCTYVQEPDTIWYIHKFTVKPPSLWWPDTSSSNNSQHGKVGWRFTIQFWDSGSWHKVKQTSVQKATAYEDSQSPYGAGTKAPLSRMSLTINAHNFASQGNFRILVKAFWYRADGSVMGSASHTVDWYKSVAGSYVQTVQSGCAHSG